MSNDLYPLVHDFKLFPELTNSQMTQFYVDSPHKQIFEDFDAQVIAVHDGDTCRVKTSFRNFDFPIRITGINSVEIGEVGADKATKWLQKKILGKMVRVIIDKNNRVGKYGRLIGDIMSEGMSISEESLRMGLSSEFGQTPYGLVLPVYELEAFLE